MNIRRMTLADLDRILEIENDSFSMPWSRETFVSDICSGFGCYFVCDLDGVIVGYLSVFTVLTEAHIGSIAVHKDYRKQGIAIALLEHVFSFLDSECELLLLEVRVSNFAAIRLYEKLGFIRVTIRKGYYTNNNEDAVIMIKYL